jgi:hypothetical protein
MAYSEVRMVEKKSIHGPNPEFFVDGAPEFLGHSLSLTLPSERKLAHHSSSGCITVVLVSITVETAATNIPNPDPRVVTVKKSATNIPNPTQSRSQ